MGSAFERVAHAVSYSLAELFGVAAAFLFIDTEWAYGVISMA